VITEPHTFDPEPEQQPDCAVACADALIQFAEFLADAKRRHRAAFVRIAVVQVVLGRMTASDAAQMFGCSRYSIYRATKLLSQQLGLEYVKGDIKATTPPGKESLRSQ
jgi:DNA-directed RNA polymerase specialized sigma24 family protein